MKSLERILPIFVFVVMLSANLLNMPDNHWQSIIMAVILAAFSGLIVFGLIRFLWWWVQR
ncbi:hypothetical protein N2F28_04405 [Leuconostoc falkenbergense]|jgi:hypothetical protein|uniref:Uncharacterized protein n=1 Tax=Leuconostoc falkenbergense TaxID=2766470 RepID=A0A9X3E936_9LACO|nr:MULTISPECIES: hypothetical protein [Leuconostoc]RDG18916.1 hypothetical protein DQM11_04865 [Leuconostoc pseudomesenteroides]MCT4378472.1 hypothetical protein [Leuconostoc falkenbergense]MCT4389847.1 hypothetical protein [Leuconostoc falkenbergense]MCT4410193.1 hypothetical protein [Leuconostoc falkenbergense]MCX7579541.1 hypothetical protein [Leuconostoc falkenbergense]